MLTKVKLKAKPIIGMFDILQANWAKEGSHGNSAVQGGSAC